MVESLGVLSRADEEAEGQWKAESWTYTPSCLVVNLTPHETLLLLDKGWSEHLHVWGTALLTGIISGATQHP